MNQQSDETFCGPCTYKPCGTGSVRCVYCHADLKPVPGRPEEFLRDQKCLDRGSRPGAFPDILSARDFEGAARFVARVFGASNSERCRDGICPTCGRRKG